MTTAKIFESRKKFFKKVPSRLINRLCDNELGGLMMWAEEKGYEGGRMRKGYEGGPKAENRNTKGAKREKLRRTLQKKTSYDPKEKETRVRKYLPKPEKNPNRDQAKDMLRGCCLELIQEKISYQSKEESYEGPFKRRPRMSPKRKRHGSDSIP
ncbi:hypothetical protein Salat_1085300 [Sesamum alatum]|uniref:Uncharacterized protein n=1 Tax=Sesamum alatum TaxID=300844 RepID=A0AAE1YMN8_9LAMI|nr:hypothetical protein Salat_1085300 [Sesamum alatum]